jgi:hypothetical protein
MNNIFLEIYPRQFSYCTSEQIKEQDQIVNAYIDVCLTKNNPTMYKINSSHKIKIKWLKRP